MKNHEPVAWIRIDCDGYFEFTSDDDLLGFAVYEKNAIDDLEQLHSDMIAINAGLKNKIDNLLETLEAVVDEIEAIRLSGDCGYWELDDEDPVSKAISLITKLRSK